MKTKTTFKIILICCVLLISKGFIKAQDKFPPSFLPPGNIAPANAPMFVMLGWDDNSYDDGLNWILDFLRNKKNANGVPARNTFFCTANRAQADANVLAAWVKASNDGHELGNHTLTHPHGKANADGIPPITTKEAWYAEITGCNNYLATNCNVGKSYGFRTPYLEFNAATFDALRDAGMLYDCSVEFGYGAGFNLQQAPWYVQFSSETGRKQYVYWPFTLENGAPAQSYTNGANLVAPGYWEFLVNTYYVPGGNDVTGFDYNIWAKSGATDVYNIWKNNFDLQHSGNKAPFMLNVHSDYYSDQNTDAITAFPKSTVAERRKAMEDFLNYILAFQDVRVVPCIDVIRWMRNPKPYTSDNAGPFTINITVSNGTVTAEPQKAQYNKGETVKLTAKPNTDYAFTGWSGGISGTDNPITITVNSDLFITAGMKFQPATCSTYLDLLTNGTWEGIQDNLGSTITVNNTALPSKTSCTWSEPQRSGDNWPWVDFVTDLDGNTLKGACSITITYKSNHDLILALPQPMFSDEGSSYMISLPASTTLVTVSKDINQFAQPSWATITGELAPDSITEISVAPDVDTEPGALSGSIEITALKIYGIGTIQNIQQMNNQTMSLYFMNDGNLIVNSKQNGNFDMTVYSVEGKLINSEKVNIKEGTNIIPLKSNLSNGIYYIKTSNDKTTIVKKIAIYR